MDIPMREGGEISIKLNRQGPLTFISETEASDLLKRWNSQANDYEIGLALVQLRKELPGDTPCFEIGGTAYALEKHKP